MAKYDQMIEKIELISRIFQFILYKFSLAITVIPPLLLSAVNYYILELGDDAYFLPVPIA